MGDVVVGGRPRRTGRRAALAILALAAVAALAVRWCAPAAEPGGGAAPTSATEGGAPDEVARAFLDAWENEDWDALQALISDQSLDAASVHEQAHSVLRITDTDFAAAPAQIDGRSASVTFDATWTLAGLEPYRYSGALRLERVAARESGAAAPSERARTWRVRWWYSTLHPSLTPEATFERLRVPQRRAPILARDGEHLARSRRVVSIGVEPRRVDDPDDVVGAVAGMTSVTAAHVRAVLRDADGDPASFYPITSVPVARFEALRPRLAAVDGLVFRHRQRRIADHGRVAQQLLGTLGEITAEQLAELGEPYSAGDQVGRSGLEEVFERRLAGTPSVEAAITDDVGVVRSLAFERGQPGEPVMTTLDIGMQRAAEAALADAPQPAALVAIDAGTGEVRAAVSTPRNGFNRAFSGLYPPGSTFKIVTAAAALRSGASADTRVPCPASVRLGGPPIRNAGGAGYGTVSLRRALAVSCNTTYARLGVRAGDETMVDTATQFGFNQDANVALASATSRFPDPDGTAELARAAIGQGRVTATPLTMASVAATAASGTWVQPTLIAGTRASRGTPVDPAVRTNLRRMMRAVVTSGTGTAANLRGAPVFGKTGSAQFGRGDRTHAWFAAHRDGVAIAVLVEGGGGGGAVAAPIARTFFARAD